MKPKVEVYDYGHGVVSQVLNLPDMHVAGRYLAVTIDTDGSLMFPSMSSAVSLSPESIQALSSFINNCTKAGTNENSKRNS